MHDRLAYFRIANDQTGKMHSFGVEVWSSRAAMLGRLERVHPDGGWRDTSDLGPAGAYVNAHGFISNEAPTALGTIYLCAEYLDIATIVHEVTHAAMFMYSCDLVGEHARALAHMVMTNETIAYMIGDLTDALGQKLHRLNLYDDAAARPTT